MAPRKRPTTLTSLDRKVDHLDRKVDHLDRKVDRLDRKFDRKIGRLDRKFDRKFDCLDRRVDELSATFDRRFDELSAKVDDWVLLMGEKFEESKRFMRMLTEELRGEFRNLAVKMVAMDEKYDRRVTHLEKHAGF